MGEDGGEGEVGEGRRGAATPGVVESEVEAGAVVEAVEFICEEANHHLDNVCTNILRQWSIERREYP